MNQTITDCPRCKVPLVIGKALYPYTEKNALYITAPAPGTAETIKMVDCLKCPKCGFSDDGK